MFLKEEGVIVLTPKNYKPLTRYYDYLFYIHCSYMYASSPVEICIHALPVVQRLAKNLTAEGRDNVAFGWVHANYDVDYRYYFRDTVYHMMESEANADYQFGFGLIHNGKYVPYTGVGGISGTKDLIKKYSYENVYNWVLNKITDRKVEV